jgi:hypothetical protein
MTVEPIETAPAPAQVAPVQAGGRHNYWIMPALPEHCGMLAKDLRALDLIEITGTGNNPKRALWRGYRNSVLCRTAFVDGRIGAMWGLCIGFDTGVSALSDAGRPWLLTAPIIERVPIAFVKEARKAVKEMLKLKPRLENCVLSSYSGAIRLLELIGFTVDPDEIKVTDVSFRRFHLTRK